MPRHGLFYSIPLHIQELDYEEGVYELGDHVGDTTSKCVLIHFGFH